jgi:hypothetical protein
METTIDKKWTNGREFEGRWEQLIIIKTTTYQRMD